MVREVGHIRDENISERRGTGRSGYGVSDTRSMPAHSGHGGAERLADGQPDPQMPQAERKIQSRSFEATKASDVVIHQSTTGESSEGSIIIISPRLKRKERDGVMRHGLIVFVAVSLKLAARNTAVTGMSPRRHALQLPAIPPSPRFPSGMNEPLACKKISCCAPRSSYVVNETRRF